MNQVLPAVTPDKLNPMQYLWFNIVQDSLVNNSQLLLIVIGTAGTGKSYTISAISNAMNANELVHGAFTAKAAFLIKGSTLHHLFSIPVDKSSNQQHFGDLTGVSKQLL